MANKERSGERINYHRRTRGAFVLPVLPLPEDLSLFDDNGRIIKRVAGGSGELSPTGNEPGNLPHSSIGKRSA